MVSLVSQNPKLSAKCEEVSWAGWLLLKLDSKFLSYGQTSVCFTKQQPDPILWEQPDGMVLKALKESL